VAVVAAGVLAGGCSATRHVPEGELMLDDVDITVEGPGAVDVNVANLHNYLRQQPNHKVLGFMKLQLGVYNLSGHDSTRWYNRWVRKLGRPPVLHDPMLTHQSARQLQLALQNMGYNDAAVSVDSVVRRDKKRLSLVYHISTGEPFVVDEMLYEVADTAVAPILLHDTLRSEIRPGVRLDRNMLDAERVRLTERMRDRGYYAFNKEYITFLADTVAGSKNVRLTMVVDRPPVAGDTVDSHALRRYIIGRVYVVTDGDAYTSRGAEYQAADTVNYRGISVLYGKDRYLKPSVIDENVYLQPGDRYSASAVDRTYEAFGRLGIVKSVNIVMRPAGRLYDDELLDTYIILSRNKKQGVTLELEGTNSEGDLGFGVGVTYQHRDLAHGSELLTAKFRGSYESLSGNLEGLINDRYTEFGAEVGITFPKFEAPLLSRSFKQRMRATSEFAVSFNHQERPEYTRIIAGAAWKYKWNNRRGSIRHTFDLIDVNFVYLPRSTEDFINSIAPDNPLLRYSYEDHFIMRMGYTYYRTNRPTAVAGTLGNTRFRPNIYTMRASAEMAGNLLYAISSVAGQRRVGDAYRVFGIQYAQYVKAEADYTYNHYFSRRTSISLHIGGGIAVPYGNSSVVPFEKRFYAGGANNVRGWGVRTLGPGRYDSRNSVTDFINQCGDISLLLNVEWRAKLFWVLEGALFIDAGNIWSIRDYPNQPGGVFRFGEFYKELAAAYGVGLRMDFDYFLLRLDLGFKAHNPAMNQEPWPLIHPDWSRDATFHFAVGYPF